MASFYKIIKPVLFKLDPETAHSAVISLLSIVQKSPVLGGLCSAVFSGPDIPLTVAGIKFKNPVGLAAGYDKDCRVPFALACLGFGFVELGTITLRPQPGNLRPRLFRLVKHEAILNRMGFNNIGAEQAAKNLEKRGLPGIPLGINIGKNADCGLDDAPQNYAAAVKILKDYADYIAVNISSPNTAGLRSLHEPERLKKLLDEVLAAAGGKPVFVKIAPDLAEDCLETAVHTAVRYGAGIIAANTTLSREGLEEHWRRQEGGLSGRPLRELSDGILAKTAKIAGGKIPIIGCGGIFSGVCAKRKLSMGADLVQVYTGLIYEGPFLIKNILTTLAKGSG